MQFGDKTDKNYKAIKKSIEHVNGKYKLDLRITWLRIDEFKKGYSYTIVDEITSLIEDCGLLIADLTCGNKNVGSGEL
jgi:hypothetical protein